MVGFLVFRKLLPLKPIVSFSWSRRGVRVVHGLCSWCQQSWLVGIQKGVQRSLELGLGRLGRILYVWIGDF